MFYVQHFPHKKLQNVDTVTVSINVLSQKQFDIRNKCSHRAWKLQSHKYLPATFFLKSRVISQGAANNQVGDVIATHMICTIFNLRFECLHTVLTYIR